MKSFRYFFITLSILICFSTIYASNIPQIIHNGRLIYLAHTVVIKYKIPPGQNLRKASNIESQVSRLLKDYNVESVTRTFSVENSDAQRIGLDKILTVNYSKDMDPIYAAAKMMKLPNIEWAEPKYIRKVNFVPNDTSYNSATQWNLFQINAQAAWDISQGDTSVIIGIVDTGVDWPHPDLRANMWYGIGYDFGGLNGTPDNNPIEDNPYHGTGIAGIASAVTNNVIGISSIGFKCHLMAVKVTREDMKDPTTGEPYIIYGFEGIVWAADHGAKVINCSWGGSGYSKMEQEVIDYALAKGALVVAAAGNDNTMATDFYPASYKGVLSVAATSYNDIKASFSNYGYQVDCSSPGVNIYSTWQPNTYTSFSGTSPATPLVSGLAALVFSHFPNYTPLQVAEQIRVNSDNIDALNPGYKNLLGYGRIDAYKTLNNTNSISIRAYDIQFSDSTQGGNGDGILQPGENVAVRIKLKNYLNPASNISISLQSLSNYITVQNGSFNLSNIGTLDSANNYSNPFIIKIADNVPYNDTIALKLNYTADNYTDYQFAMTPVNVTYKTQISSNITITINSQGSLGFNDYPTNLQGDGFKFMDGSNLLFEGALMFGTSSVKLSDEARDANSGAGKDTSFQIIDPITITNKPDINLASEEGYTSFNDNGSGVNKLGITVKLHSYLFNDTNNKNSVLLNYDFTNTTNTDISNFYTGLFFDWDLVEGSGDSDIVNYDNVGNLGYVYHLGGNPDTYVGTALISSDQYGFWAFDNPVVIYDGFSNSEKWQALSSGIGNASAGPTDISEVTSAGPFSIPAGKSINVAFAITAGTNLDELRTSISNARDVYNNQLDTINGGAEIPLTYSLSQNYPNPFNPGTKIDYEIPEEGRVTIKIYDILGRLVKTLLDEDKQPGKYTLKFYPDGLASGVYFYQLKVNSFTSTKKLVVLK